MFFSLKSLLFTFCTLWSSFIVYNISNVFSDFENFNNIEQNEIDHDEVNDEKIGVEKDENIKKENHIMTLMIPKLNINNKIYSKESAENNIDKNVQLMNASSMPDSINGNVILGGHSGTGKLAYFKRLDELVIGDIVILHYKGEDYSYKIVNYYIDDKDGHIVISRDLNKSSITLFTCNPNDKNNYLVIIGELV